ncbi:PTPRK-like protein, partial [Mya arenaria]
MSLKKAGVARADDINKSLQPTCLLSASGPTEEFVSDFWRMIWQKQCRKIVKCCQYWPDEGRKQYGGVTVEARDADTFSDYTEKGESRVVKHFQFEAWSDRHVPEYASSVLHFRGCVQAHDSKDNVPTVVHCSAGIGRSGTYLALDYLAEQADVEGYVNVFQCVQNLRHQRVNMVQNLEQYMFLHEALAEALFCPNAALPADRFAASYQRALEAPAGGKQPRLELEFQRLQHVTKFHESMKPSFYEGEEYRAARAFENTQKNRTRNILPSDLHRPFLTTRVADTNDYINAVFLPSYRESKSFLLTQNPLADTIIDFWRMYEVYWPSESETVTFIPFQLHFVTEVDHVTHIERTIKLTNAEEPKEKARLIKQYECRFWMSESHVPVGAESSLLAVCDHAAKWQTANGNPPIVAHCQNGATKSGLFCVVMATVERVKQERDVALQQTEQYKFIHDVVIDFLRATELLPTICPGTVTYIRLPKCETSTNLYIILMFDVLLEPAVDVEVADLSLIKLDHHKHLPGHTQELGGQLAVTRGIKGTQEVSTQGVYQAWAIYRQGILPPVLVTLVLHNKKPLQDISYHSVDPNKVLGTLGPARQDNVSHLVPFIKVAQLVT